MEIIIIKKEISPIIDQANSLVISDSPSMSIGVEMLSKANKTLDKIIEEREKITAPLNQALKAERSRWKPLVDTLETAIDSIRTKLSSYQTEQIRLQKIAEEKISARVEKGTLKIETALKKLDEASVEERVETVSGSLKFRETQVLKIIDEKLIPREYLIINEKKVLEALKTGVVVPGAEIEIIMTPINYR